MNVKTLASEPINSMAKPSAKTAIKAGDSSPDRDADGRRHDQREGSEEALSDVEFEKVLNLLNEHEGIKNSSLIIDFEEQGESRMAIIKDPQGKIIRRIPDYQLRSFLKEKESNKGHLLNKAA